MKYSIHQEVRRFGPLQLGTDGRLYRYQARGPACAHRGCKRIGSACWLPDDDDRPGEYLCWKHIDGSGYCVGCGQFWAGVESFDLSRSQLCDNCEFQHDDDYGRAFHDDYEFDPWEDALSNCYSQDWGQTCGAAGSEDCEFDCPIRRDARRAGQLA